MEAEAVVEQRESVQSVTLRSYQRIKRREYQFHHRQRLCVPVRVGSWNSYRTLLALLLGFIMSIFQRSKLSL